MDETKIELPAWLPWATTACLAALVACLVELWIIEKTRNQLIRDEEALGQVALQAAQNQLEAERIVSSREVASLRMQRTEILHGRTPGGPLAAGPWGVAEWSPDGKTLLLHFAELAAQHADRDYQLWIEGSGPGYPKDCGAIRPISKDNPADAVVVRLDSPIPADYRILLIDGAKGGAPTLGDAKAGGSIILASTPAR
jgi:hypothetical protein